MLAQDSMGAWGRYERMNFLVLTSGFVLWSTVGNLHDTNSFGAAEYFCGTLSDVQLSELRSRVDAVDIARMKKEEYQQPVNLRPSERFFIWNPGGTALFLRCFLDIGLPEGNYFLEQWRAFHQTMSAPMVEEVVYLGIGRVWIEFEGRQFSVAMDRSTGDVAWPVLPP